MLVIMLLVLILNLTSIANFIKIARKEKKTNINTFQIIALFLNITDFACGMYLAIILSSNIYYKGSYAINELHWQSYIACYVTSHLLTFFHFVTDLLLLNMIFIKLSALTSAKTLLSF